MGQIKGTLSGALSANDLQNQINNLDTGKQEKLISKVNIRTIGGQDLLDFSDGDNINIMTEHTKIRTTGTGDYDVEVNEDGVFDLSEFLSEVDNTSDINKPISAATQAALNTKANISNTYTINDVDTRLAGKEPIINVDHKVLSDYINDENQVHKFVSAEEKSQIATNTEKRHEHDNKALLDTYNQTNANLADAVSKKHEHSNKAVLDATTASYTIADASKLSGIAAGAQVNVLEGVKVNGVELEVSEKKVDIIIPAIPENVSAFTNDAGYLTEHQSLDGYATESWVTNQGYLTEHQDISGKQDKSSLEADVAAKGFTKNAGTLTGVSMNGAEVTVSNGVAILGTVITDVSNKQDKIDAEHKLDYSLIDNVPPVPGQIQADWNQVDDTQSDYIKNKPDIPTKASLGLDNVDNTSDLNKPISTATQTALNGKQDTLTFDDTPTANSNNPVKSSGIKDYVDTYGGKIDLIKINNVEQSITNKVVNLPAYPTKESLGLANVDNTSDANKPISNATQTALDGKQAKIDASNKLSASYVSGLATVATSGAYADLSGLPTIPDAQIQADWNQTDNTKKDFIKNKPTIPTVSYPVTDVTVNSASVLDGTVAKITVPTKVSDLQNDSGYITGVTWNAITGKPSFATVATTGSYLDLSNKPSIPAAQIQADWEQSDISALDYIKNKPNYVVVDEATVAGWGFTKNAGTITSVKMNGSTVAFGGEADLGTVITQHQDISGKQNLLTTSSVTDGTPVTVIGFNSSNALVKGVFENSPVQDLTGTIAFTLDATAWATLKSAHTYTVLSPVMTGLNANKEFVNIKGSINSNDQYIKLNKNTTNKYSGLFFIEETVSTVTSLYEISVYYNGSSIILRCATVY